jgi:hypothetical protein
LAQPGTFGRVRDPVAIGCKADTRPTADEPQHRSTRRNIVNRWRASPPYAMVEGANSQTEPTMQQEPRSPFVHLAGVAAAQRSSVATSFKQT